jgi:hypothetical protein
MPVLPEGPGLSEKLASRYSCPDPPRPAHGISFSLSAHFPRLMLGVSSCRIRELSDVRYAVPGQFLFLAASGNVHETASTPC